MTLRLALVRHLAPATLKARMLDELAVVTADGLGCRPPRWTGRRLETRLDDYARFTAAHAEAVLAGHDAAAVDLVRLRLHQGAERLGGRLRGQLGLRSHEAAVDALAVLYRHLGIEMQAGSPGELIVTSCRFSAFFSEPVCGLVAGLDEGLAAGLSGGGRLEFVERLTGGSPCCRARFTPAGRR